jgi:hypothetical protein
MSADKVLKPCPHCDGDPRIIQRKQNEPDEWQACAYCPSCDPRFMNAISVDLWNTRPIEDELQAEIERLEDALHRIEQWSRAYPLKVFPEPDFERVHELLKAGGISIDSVSASNMRHVVEGVGKIARDALKEGTP